MSKILITGAGGYIGSVATDLFLSKGYEVVGIDNFQTGYKEPLELLKNKYLGKFHYYEADLKNDLSPIFEKEKDIAAVIHYAASCLVDESMNDPGKYFLNNVAVTSNLLSTMDKYNIKNIIFSSTCAIYGEAKYFPIDEKHPLKPTTPYGASKKMAEEVISWHGKLKGFNYMILRYFNVCGASEDGSIGDSKKPSSLLVQNAVRGALGIEKFFLTCPEVDTPDKTPIRDYIDVVDLNEAHLKALEYLLSTKKSEIINLGTGTGSSVLEVINQVKKLTGVEIPILKANIRQGDDAKKVADIKKAEKILGWKPNKTIEDSVRSLIVWYKSHPNGWEK
ncbi:UDP-glucose 4-epimerase GalE [Candidatus Roizmanbacteria bacterium CG_4_8_14_3_um_filter_34_9]|uniref:UDP-glucose 4-epimerase n=2 Tax=Candidatus Roizmaniibacteriota TaxID=1752723 RepID=A0A2M7ATH5_9BACT|nr:MAG: UDP-glucose 4-epimerase GalE [Candidatus Roizmanbacteria bacterium CG06_land_8_20_14_3_00_34_14]PIW73596.1 MAG: UDP-glucose 4-epimerase GalE [Candidatus Roizmanbacteria bacterium CG_4_8_14_3_um_filter_34_9]